MISRYSAPRMAHLFSDENRMELWREIEIAAMRASHHVPEEAVEDAEATRAPALGWAEAVAERERETGHDVAAFVDVMGHQFKHPGRARFLHFGLTSSDLVDTALAIQVNQALVWIARDVHTLYYAMKAKAAKHSRTPRLARTHGQGADVTTLGHQLAYHAMGLHRSWDRFATLEVAGKLSGPIGTNAAISREEERRALESLGVPATRVATQVVMRDDLARVVTELAILASVIDGFALMVRLGAQTGIEELHEGAAWNRTGSSSMPHKRNPITSEKIHGLALLARSMVVPIMQNIALWNERDISNSSVERVALPDMFNLMDHLVQEATTLLTELQVDKARMRENLEACEGVASFIKTNELVERGYDRREARQIGRTAHYPPTLIDEIEKHGLSWDRWELPS